MLARNCLRLVAADLARLNAAGLINPLHPTDGRADRHPKLLGGLIAGHPALNGRHDAIAKIQRVRLTHPMLASCPASMVNQKRTDLGIPNRFRLNPSRFSVRSDVYCTSICK